MKLIILLILLTILGTGIVFLIMKEQETISGEEYTMSMMESAEYHIIQYYEINNKLPRSLTEVYLFFPELVKSHDDFRRDAWGGLIEMSLRNNVVELHSYGKDGKERGAGDNKDISRSFKINRPENGAQTKLQENNTTNNKKPK